MNKIAQYLNTHMLGEVVTNPEVRAAYSHDGSVLTHTPDMVAFPRATSDIRKIARFSWQLAEKGHTLPLTVRGAGTDTTGAAIGTGMVVGMTAHMNRIFEYDPGQKLVRLQPGVTINALDNALGLHGTAIPELRWEQPQATIGGAIASSRAMADCIDQLEIVLASGDVLQTKRLNKRELGKKKGLTGFEGDIYRAIDALIEDNTELLDELVYNDDRVDHEGYAGIEEVKHKDGSFDLTPLFVGSQGTLGIISEMILKADFVNQSPSLIVASFAEAAHARDAVDKLEEAQPSAIEYIDNTYFEAAMKAGKVFPFYEQASEQLGKVAAVIVVTVNDFNERHRSRKVKKIRSLLKPMDAEVVSTDDLINDDLRALLSVTYWALNPDNTEFSMPPLLDGVYVPIERFDEFSRNLEALGERHHVTLSLYGRPLDELWYIRPVLRLASVGDKQKLFKLAAELAELVEKHSGTPFGASGEGRFGAGIRSETGAQAELYRKIKAIFDPYGSLNPGVKQHNHVRDLAKQLRGSFSGPAATHHLTKF
ncbi:MAG TPA: FAD-binding oxidoreductase [Candidatus Saccharibacteria bacterium]|nr:FAD-binding oxidoreductase [Candidatus Saccharibacteria bacterium]HRK94506.1 FAD-binding oxidoreductase [Candidatus Saccharibacteria bacterium]